MLVFPNHFFYEAHHLICSIRAAILSGLGKELSEAKQICYRCCGGKSSLKTAFTSAAVKYAGAQWSSSLFRSSHSFFSRLLPSRAHPLSLGSCPLCSAEVDALSLEVAAFDHEGFCSSTIGAFQCPIWNFRLLARFSLYLAVRIVSKLELEQVERPPNK